MGYFKDSCPPPTPTPKPCPHKACSSFTCEFFFYFSYFKGHCSCSAKKKPFSVEKDTERKNVTVEVSGKIKRQGPTILEQKEKSQGNSKTIWYPGFDARFPNQNQTRRCWQNYVDYFRCQEKFGEDYEGCEYFKKTYELLCPGFWIERWNEQRENGTFPYPRR